MFYFPAASCYAKYRSRPLLACTPPPRYEIGQYWLDLWKNASFVIVPRHIRDLSFHITIRNSQVEEDGLGGGGGGSRGAGSSDELWAQMQVLVSQSSFTLLLVFGFLAILVLVFGILVSQSSITLLWYSSLIHCFHQKRDNAMLEIAWIGPAAEKGLKTFEKKIPILTILYFNMVYVIKHKHCQWQNGPRHWVVHLFLSASTWLGLATFTKVERAVSEWVTYRQDDGRTWVQKVV